MNVSKIEIRAIIGDTRNEKTLGAIHSPRWSGESFLVSKGRSWATWSKRL